MNGYTKAQARRACLRMASIAEKLFKTGVLSFSAYGKIVEMARRASGKV